MKKFITVLLVTTGLSNFAFGLINEVGGALKTGLTNAINNVENFAQGGIDTFGNAAKDLTGQVGNFVEGAGHFVIDTGVNTMHQGITFVEKGTATAIHAAETVVSGVNTAANTAAALTGGCTCNK